ncbi:type II CAAX endopeptidase family protein [Microbacterium sp. ARD32]|uniref:CPBP family intramembrane glutamic endopeptidase n=1 Tax=Microbacterium sp. ARD32 TaxID=2962577 RepID=UPI002880C170|nr:type II CAAX endopeptidase family protein [Microbacterium sp. ARD32]MDT0158550.1 type II CAAX endopeptidase family protein [Microbacterium sp. ARD32]
MPSDTGSAAYPPPPPPAPRPPVGARPPAVAMPAIAMQSGTAASDALAFHRLDRARSRPLRWWRPLLVAVVAVALYLVMLIAIFVPFVILSLIMPEPTPAMEALARGEVPGFDVADPTGFLLLVVPLILMIPALLAASRMVGGRGAGLLLSVAGRLRWGWLGRSLLAAVAVYAVQTALSLLLEVASGGSVAVDLSQPGLLLMLVLIVLLVPLQSAAEEYVFRGFLMQAIGTWLRHPLFPILLPIPLFVFGHLYDVWGLLSVAVFAVTAAWLVWRTGGLEAAIALHAVNNVSAFGLEALGLADANATTGTPMDVIITAVTMAVYVAIIEGMQRRSGLMRTRVVSAPAPTLSATLSPRG